MRPPFFLLRGYPSSAKLVLPPWLTPIGGTPPARSSRWGGAPPSCGDSAGPARCVRLPCCLPDTLPY
jgi:hypothetical protein